MRYKKTVFSALAAMLSVMVILTACGNAKLSNQSAPAQASDVSYSGMSSAVAERGPMAVAPPVFVTDQNKADVTVTATLPDRKIVKRSYLTLETKEFDTALGQLLAAITEQGGYIESQSTNGQSLIHRGAYYERSASIQARIPADKLDSVTAAIGGIGNVTSKNESIDDITDSYFDSQARLDSLKLQEERLLDILSKAEKLEDVISLERALSDVRYQIESLTATMRRMDSQIAYSYLNLELREVVEYQPTTSAPKTLGEKIAASFKRSGEKLVWFFEAVLLFIIEDLPLIIIWIAIFGLLAFISFKQFHRINRKMHDKKLNDSQAEPTREQEPPAEK